MSLMLSIIHLHNTFNIALWLVVNTAFLCELHCLDVVFDPEYSLNWITPRLSQRRAFLVFKFHEVGVEGRRMNTIMLVTNILSHK